MELNLSTLTPVAVSVALTLAGLATGLIIRRSVIPRLARAAGTTARADNVLVAALRGPVVLWSTMLGIYLAAQIAPIPGAAGPLVRKLLVVLLIVSITWSLGRAVAAAVTTRATAVGMLPSVNLISNLARILVLALGGLVILQTLGISITPLVTALGVGGLAVGLALQDTLANLFAGIHILVSRQVRPRDYVRLESGEEGYVQDVTWRYTTIRQLPNNLTIVPNAKLASAVITNFYLPHLELAVLVPVGVSYDSDLGRVESVTIAVGKEVMTDVQGGVPEFDPFIRYDTFGDSRITFTVILRGREVVDQHLIRHEFIKRLHSRYRAEGIEIPFPQRTVHLRTADAGGSTRKPPRLPLTLRAVFSEAPCALRQLPTVLGSHSLSVRATYAAAVRSPAANLFAETPATAPSRGGRG
jgi:small-conductance mechanosensitive channel